MHAARPTCNFIGPFYECRKVCPCTKSLLLPDIRGWIKHDRRKRKKIDEEKQERQRPGGWWKERQPNRTKTMPTCIAQVQCRAREEHLTSSIATESNPLPHDKKWSKKRKTEHVNWLRIRYNTQSVNFCKIEHQIIWMPLYGASSLNNTLIQIFINIKLHADVLFQVKYCSYNKVKKV